MRIERWIMVVAVVTAGTASLASSIPESSGTDPRHGAIDVRLVWRIELHPGVENLKKLCRANWEVDGCTDFPVEKLECECERQGNVWVVNVSANLEAVTHLRNTSEQGRLMVHEALHVTDLEAGLRKHLETLAAWQYDSLTSCRRHARLLNSLEYARAVMNQLRVESNAKFGCSRTQM